MRVLVETWAVDQRNQNIDIEKVGHGSSSSEFTGRA